MNQKQVRSLSLPHSRESEMMVLGCMVNNLNSLNHAAGALAPEDFYFSEHKFIFEVLKACYCQDTPADIHIISEELKRKGHLASVGGLPYLTDLVQYAGTSAHIEKYTELVKDKAILRRMVGAVQLIEKQALENPGNVQQCLDDAQQSLYAIGQASNPSAGLIIKDILSGVQAESNTSFLRELQERQEQYQEHGDQASDITGLKTSFTDLDKIINGLNDSHLMILAARPAMGKTAFALNIAENICFSLGKSVGIFSLEMNAEQLVHRIICSQSEVESQKIKTGSLNGLEYQRIVESINCMNEHCMVIDEQPHLSITDLRARARRMKERHHIDFLVIDYLQLISGSSSQRNQENRQSEISEISRMLKILARELDIPVLCLSQLSRKVEERAGHRPLMSDLRESGSIEQDADIVMFLLRREYYDPMDKPGMAELIIAKNRHGAIGNVNLTFRKEFAQFANFAHPEEESSEEYNAFSAFSPH